MATIKKSKKLNLDAVKTEGFYYDCGTPEKPKHDYYYGGKLMTGCTTILGILAKPALISWAARMACEHIEKNAPHVPGCDYLVSAELLKEAQTAHAKFRDKRASEGTDVHSLVETWIKYCIEHNDGYPKVYEEGPIKEFTIWAIKENIRFLSSEQQFYSTSLFVAGTADMTFEKDGKRYVGDLKNKKKIYGRDAQFQCAGYATMAEEMGERPFDGFCIIRLWENEIETIWSGDTYGDREGFLACVKLYRLINN